MFDSPCDQLTQLPIELQLRIIELSPSLIVVFSQVSHQYDRLLENVYLSVVGAQLIMDHEVSRQPPMSQLPSKALVIVAKQGTYAACWCHLLQIDPIGIHKTYLQVMMSHTGQVTLTSLSHSEVESEFFLTYPDVSYCATSSMEVSILAANRRKCMRLDSKYHQRFTLQRLEARYQEYLQARDGIDQLESQWVIICTYLKYYADKCARPLESVQIDTF